MHNAMNLQPPRPPISPSPHEVEIPSVEARVQRYMDAGYFEQYGHKFYPDVGATSSTPAPREGVFGLSTFYGAAGWTGLTSLSFLYSETVIIRTLILFVDLRIVMCATLCYEPFLIYLSGFVLV